MKSATQSRFGPVAVNSRSTRSAGRSALSSGRVVRGPLSALDHALEAFLAHQPLEPVARHINPFPFQLTPDFPGTVEPAVLYEHPVDLRDQLQIPDPASRQVRFTLQCGVVGGRGEIQRLADRLDPDLSRCSPMNSIISPVDAGRAPARKKPKPPSKSRWRASAPGFHVSGP